MIVWSEGGLLGLPLSPNVVPGDQTTLASLSLPMKGKP